MKSKLVMLMSKKKKEKNIDGKFFDETILFN